VRGVYNFSTGRPQNLDGIRDLIDFRETDILDLDAMNRACRGVDYVIHQAGDRLGPKIGARAAEQQSDECGRYPQRPSRRPRREGEARCLRGLIIGVWRQLHSTQARGHAPGSDFSLRRLQARRRVLHGFVLSLLSPGAVCLRYFNIFGPRQDPTSTYSGVLAKFINQMLSGEQPTIFGDGETSRDFTHVDDAVQANLLACKAPAEQVAGRVFNVATGRPTTLKDIFPILEKLTGYGGDPKYGGQRK